MKAAACWIIITHMKKRQRPKTLVCESKQRRRFHAGFLFSVTLPPFILLSKAKCKWIQALELKIFIYARLLSCTCLIFPFLFLVLLFLGNMQSLSGLHPGFHVRPWLLDWDADRRWERLKSQVEAALACRAESTPWRPCLLIRPDVLLMPTLHYKYF